VPTAGIASVEVARGAGATLYGSDAMGGAVQVVTRPPAFDRPFTAFGRAAWLSPASAWRRLRPLPRRAHRQRRRSRSWR